MSYEDLLTQEEIAAIAAVMEKEVEGQEFDSSLVECLTADQRRLIRSLDDPYDPLSSALTKWTTKQRRIEREERGVSAEDAAMEILIPTDVREWTRADRAFVKRSIQRYGFPRFPKSMRDLEEISVQRRYVMDCDD